METQPEASIGEMLTSECAGPSTAPRATASRNAAWARVELGLGADDEGDFGAPKSFSVTASLPHATMGVTRRIPSKGSRLGIKKVDPGICLRKWAVSPISRRMALAREDIHLVFPFHRVSMVGPSGSEGFVRAGCLGLNPSCSFHFLCS